MKDTYTKQRRKMLKKQRDLNVLEALILTVVIIAGLFFTFTALLYTVDLWGATTCEYYKDCHEINSIHN